MIIDPDLIQQFIKIGFEPFLSRVSNVDTSQEIQIPEALDLLADVQTQAVQRVLPDRATMWKLSNLAYALIGHALYKREIVRIQFNAAMRNTLPKKPQPVIAATDILDIARVP